MWKYIQFALKNSLRNKRRTFLTIASITVSLFLLGMLFAMYHAFYFRQGPPEQALRLVCRNRVSLAFPLPEYYEAKIRQVPGVREVTTRNWFGGVYIDDRPEHFFPRFSTDPQTIFKVYPELKMDPDQLQAFQADRAAAAIGRTLAEKQGFKLGQRFTIKGDIYPVNLEFTLKAIFEGNEGSSDNVMYFHRKYVEESLPEAQRGSVGTYCMLADSPESVPRIAREIDDMFRNSDRQTKTESERAFQLSFVAMLGNVKVLLLSICGAVVFTILLVSANTMAMSVRERVKEIGVLKTLGFTTPKVLFMIIAESLFMAAVGGFLGCGLAFLVCSALNQVSYVRLIFFAGIVMPPTVLAVSLSVALSIGFMSSIIPAMSANRISITEALRHVG
ncbi:MAG TPA: FtsX-like permease family protein [Terriglobia bacterium]|nr:FtsX-like permease family protein [Terriglobia bacterium]